MQPILAPNCSPAPSALRAPRARRLRRLGFVDRLLGQALEAPPGRCSEFRLAPHRLHQLQSGLLNFLFDVADLY
eukprot:6063553-Pyramimonas_sp.AAC.1